MAEQNKKRRKREHLNDFYLDVSGKYVYRGKMYAYVGPLPRKAALVKAWTFAGLAAAAQVANGFLPVPSLNGCFYVVVPYVIGLIAVCSAVWALGRITVAGDRLREYVYQETAAQLPTRCMVGAVCSGLAFAGQLLYLLLNGTQQKLGLMLLFAAFQFIATVTMYKLKRFNFEDFWQILE